MNNGKVDFEVYTVEYEVMGLKDKKWKLGVYPKNTWFDTEGEAIHLKQQILNNQAIVERLQQVIDDYKKQVWESPTNHRMVVKHLELIMTNSTKHSNGSGDKNGLV